VPDAVAGFGYDFGHRPIVPAPARRGAVATLDPEEKALRFGPD